MPELSSVNKAETGSKLDNKKILLTWNVGVDSRWTFDSWAMALEFMNGQTIPLVNVWYDGGDGWHFWGMLIKQASNAPPAPDGYKWEH